MKLSIRGTLALAVVSIAPSRAFANDIAVENYGTISLDQNNALVTAPYGTNGRAADGGHHGLPIFASQIRDPQSR